MKASVQYNDFRGTAAADISDFYMNSLQKYLEDTYQSYDGERYSCIGCTLWITDRNIVRMRFVCFDKQENKYVKFESNKDFSYIEAFSLFKRFEIVMGKGNFDEIEVEEGDESLILM